MFLVKAMSMVSQVSPMVYVAVSLAAVWYLKARKRVPNNIPPFPVQPYRILGHIPMMTGGVVETLREWRRSTGDIYSIYIGSQLYVVMSSAKILKEAFVKQGDLFSNRAKTFAGRNLKNGNLGIIESSGANWKEQRSAAMSILRNFGMGKNFLAEKISEEVAVYLDALSECKGYPSDIRLLTNASVCNVICAILIGERFDFDDLYFTKILNLLHKQVLLLGKTNLLNSFPWLKYLPGDCFHASKVLENSREILEQFTLKFIKESKESEDDNRVDNFINAYYDEMRKKKEAGLPTHLDEENLLFVVSNLFLAGTETTSSTILWAVLFAIRHPEEQAKVYNEIVEVIGTGRVPSVQDKPNMNYTNAFIMETQRLGSIAPLGLSHLCIQTTEVAGYTIPAGTSIMPNLDEVLKDEATWIDPLTFRPGRFLNENGDLEVPEEFLVYSLGRRVCMGESMAKVELFLYVTGMIQRFQIEPEDPDNLPSNESVFGITCAPKPFKPRLVERN